MASDPQPFSPDYGSPGRAPVALAWRPAARDDADEDCLASDNGIDIGRVYRCDVSASGDPVWRWFSWWRAGEGEAWTCHEAMADLQRAYNAWRRVRGIAGR